MYIIRLYRDNGKENGNYDNGLHRVRGGSRYLTAENAGSNGQ